MLKLLRALVVLSALAAPAALASHRPGGPIPTGKWIGFLKVDGNPDGLALTLDTFLVSPADVTQFPKQQLLFKVALGGHASAEYDTHLFADPSYDYGSGLLTLDEPENDLVVTALVYSEPTIMEGDVQFRATGASGTFFLKFMTDEPSNGNDEPEQPPFAPALAGQYEGRCGDHDAVLQLETARGLTADNPTPPADLHEYFITGALGIANGLCSRINGPGRPAWCVDHAFSTGSYDYVQGRLFLNGGLETDECTRRGDELTCKAKILPPGGSELVPVTCALKKTRGSFTPLEVFDRRYHVATAQGQRAPLPLPSPPLNEALRAAVHGTYFGWLHHEQSDRYQPLRLAVVATNSTPNPHVENMVHVSVTSSLWFGRGATGELWAAQYDRRPFYLSQGFTLRSDKSDSFLQITEWGQGYVSGVWYSLAYGRIGTFELVKGAALPELAAAARVVPSVAGEFRGPGERSDGYWETTVMVPQQPRNPGKGHVVFQGNARLHAGGVAWPTQRISQGSYDLYSGAVSFMSDGGSGEPKLVTGLFDQGGGLRLFWPGERAWAVGVLDRDTGTYPRVTP